MTDLAVYQYDKTTKRLRVFYPDLIEFEISDDDKLLISHIKFGDKELDREELGEVFITLPNTLQRIQKNIHIWSGDRKNDRISNRQ